MRPHRQPSVDAGAGQTPPPPAQAGHQALQQAPGRRGQAFQVTPPNNAAQGVAGSTRTPPGRQHHHHDNRQRSSGSQSSPPGPAGPPPHPFRLHRPHFSKLPSSTLFRRGRLHAPSPRQPLQELAVSPLGHLVGSREPYTRPVPSTGKENLPASRDALEHRGRRRAPRATQVAAILHLALIRQARSQQSPDHAPADSTDTDLTFSLANHFGANRRISMPLGSDDSGSEPDLSLLGIARGGAGTETRAHAMAYDEAGEDDDEVLSQEHYEMEDTSIEEQGDEQETAQLFDPATVGLKEISNLGKFTVSSHKPGCGVDGLRSDDLKLCWQSDGPQPHKLTIYFVKRVGIRDIRFFVDYNEDESYTPSKIVFKSGTSENSLIEFATMSLDSPVGWQQVPIAGSGGEPDGNTLVSYVLQMQILENHQNGKDTHLRGFKIYALDADAAHGPGQESNVAGHDMDLTGDVADQESSSDRLGDIVRSLAAARLESGEAGFTMPDFMREPEIR